MTLSASEFAGRRPTILTVPGLHGSGPAHWQTVWEQSRGDTVRADLGTWSAPSRNAWVTRLEQAIHGAQAPVILAAHSLGCLAVAWWAALSGQPWGWPVAGALLVAPPDCDRSDARIELQRFAPAPRLALPFPSIVVSSEDDPWCSRQRAFDMARDWGSGFEEVGALGHINAASGVGFWHDGQALLERLVGASETLAHGGTPADVARALRTSPQASA